MSIRSSHYVTNEEQLGIRACLDLDRIRIHGPGGSTGLRLLSRQISLSPTLSGPSAITVVIQLWGTRPPETLTSRESSFQYVLRRFCRSIKGESQDTNLPRDWKKRKCSPCFPAHLMLRGSCSSSSRQIHSVVVTTLSDSEAKTSDVVETCQPWFYLRLEAYSFFWSSEGDYSLPRDWRCSAHTCLTA